MNIHHYFFTFTYSFCLWIVHLHMQYRGGSRISSYGGGALKKIAPSGGRRENCWGISCEKSRFYAKKSYFFPILGEARAGCSPLDTPLQYMTTNYGIQVVQRLCQSMRMTTDIFFKSYLLVSYIMPQPNNW
jgi:hypothetical protein